MRLTIPMTKDAEREALKVEPRSPMISGEIQQPSGEQGKTIAPSTSIKDLYGLLRH
jgi:hypothetical protein